MKSSESRAWFFDFEGKEGLRKAHGFLRIIYAISLATGIMDLIFFKKFLTHGHYAVLTGIIAISSACWVMTFQENYGSRNSSYVEILKTGIKEVFSSRVLLLVVVSSIFIDFQCNINLCFPFSSEDTCQEFRWMIVHRHHRCRTPPL